MCSLLPGDFYSEFILSSKKYSAAWENNSFFDQLTPIWEGVKDENDRARGSHTECVFVPHKANRYILREETLPFLVFAPLLSWSQLL